MMPLWHGLCQLQGDASEYYAVKTTLTQESGKPESLGALVHPPHLDKPSGASCDGCVSCNLSAIPLQALMGGARCGAAGAAGWVALSQLLLEDKAPEAALDAAKQVRMCCS